MFQGDKLLMDQDSFDSHFQLRSESFSTASLKKKKIDIEYSHLQSLLWPTAAEANFTIYHPQVLSRILRCSCICVKSRAHKSRSVLSWQQGVSLNLGTRGPHVNWPLLWSCLWHRTKESITGRLQDTAVSHILIMSKEQNIPFNMCLHKNTGMKFVEFYEIE